MPLQVKAFKKSAAVADRQRQKLIDEKSAAEEQVAAARTQLSEVQDRLAAAEKLAKERVQQLQAGEARCTHFRSGLSASHRAICCH